MPRPAKRPAKPAAKKSKPAPAKGRVKTEKLDWKALNDLGSDETLAGDFESAIGDFTAAIELAPNEVLPYYNRGNARMMEGDLAGASEDLTKALELDPEFVSAYQQRGAVKQSIGDVEGALADFDAALRIAPDDPDTLSQRAIVRSQRSDFEGAVQDVGRALAIAPEDWGMRKDAESMLRAMQKAQKAHQAGHEHPESALTPHAHEEKKERATSVVEEALNNAEWPFNRVDNSQGVIDFVTEMDEEGLIEAIVLRLSERLERLVLYVLFRPKAKKEHRPELCEFIARANYGMGDGNFELDMEQGTVRFKVALDFAGISLPMLLVRNMIADAMSTVEVYESALARVIAGKAKAKAALRAAEQAAMQRGTLQ